MSANREAAIAALGAALDQELYGRCLNLCDGKVEIDTDPEDIEDILANLEARGWTMAFKPVSTEAPTLDEYDERTVQPEVGDQFVSPFGPARVVRVGLSDRGGRGGSWSVAYSTDDGIERGMTLKRKDRA